MQKEGLIPLKSSTDQAIASLYFLRISNSFCSLCFVKSASMITGLDLSLPKKAYLRCLCNSFRIKLSKLFSTYYAFSSLLLDFSALPSFRLSIVFVISKLAFRYSTSRDLIYWKFISFSFIEL